MLLASVAAVVDGNAVDAAAVCTAAAAAVVKLLLIMGLLRVWLRGEEG
jgi:hypothetical protein